MTRKYKTSYKSHRNSRRFGVTFSAPAEPMSEIDTLSAKIEKEQAFIEKYQENYSWLADEARSRIACYEKRLIDAVWIDQYGAGWESTADALHDALINGNERIELDEQAAWLGAEQADGCGTDADLYDWARGG